MAKILIVEDEKALNEAYELVLKKEGHNVRAVYNGIDGAKAFKEELPDLVLLDLRMPKLDGIGFLKKLEPAKNYPDTKIIIFSNYDEQTEVEEAIKLGASRYILKAWSSPAELVKIVEQSLDDQASD